MTARSYASAAHPLHPILRRMAIGLTLLVTLLIAVTARGDNDPRLPRFVDVRVGFDDQYKLGCWTPLDIRIQGGTQSLVGRLSVTVPDGDDVPTEISVFDNRPIQFLPGQTSEVRLYVKVGRETSELPVELTIAGERPIRRVFSVHDDVAAMQLPWALASEQTLYVNVGPLIGIVPTGERVQSTSIAELSNTHTLPTRWFGYEGVDTLILSATRPEDFSQFLPGTAQHEALHDWLQMGGRMILCVGAAGREVLAADGPLGPFAPGRLEEIATLTRADALESFSGTNERVPLGGRSRELKLPVAKLTNITGRVVLEDQGLPLVIRTPYGFGEVLFVGVDLGQRPLAMWHGRDDFVHRLLLDTDKPGEQDATATTNVRARAFGIFDLAGQLRSGLDQFTGVTVVPFWIVGGLVFVYILAIGPGDYLFVRYVLRRMELTWITFPAIVVLVCGGAYVAATITKGNRLLVNQVDVVDFDTDSGLVRGTSWLNVFSPSTSAYNLHLEPAAEAALKSESSETLFSWFGLPGRGWGGMQSNGGPALFGRSYSYSPQLDRLIGAPIDIWGTKSFTARWRATASQAVDADLKVSFDRTLRGEVTSRLAQPLDECVLLYDRWAYPIGSLKPGDQFDIQGGDQRDLEAVLKSFQAVRNAKNTAFIHQATPWDVEGTDVPRIVQLMLFFQAAEGEAYSGLGHRSQDFIDMSGTLRSGRAVLLGRGPADKPAMSLHDDQGPVGGDHDRHWTFYRFVFAVDSDTTTAAKSP